jgi:hypothetical protein
MAILDSLAGYLWLTGQLREAFLLYNRALKIYEREFGVDHINSADTINNIGLSILTKGSMQRRSHGMNEHSRSLSENSESTISIQLTRSTTSAVSILNKGSMQRRSHGMNEHSRSKSENSELTISIQLIPSTTSASSMLNKRSMQRRSHGMNEHSRSMSENSSRPYQFSWHHQ